MPRSPEAEGGSGAGGSRAPLVWVVQLLATAAVAWFVVDRIGLSFQEMGEVDLSRWSPAPWPFTASCAILLLGYLLSGVLWGLLTRDMGGGAVSHSTAVRLYLVSNLARYVPGKVWQIAGLAVLAREEGIPARVAATSAVVGQGVSLLAATAIGTAVLVGGGPGGDRAGVWVLVGAGVIGVVALVPGVTRRVASAWFRVAGLEEPAGGHRPVTFVLRWVTLYGVNWIVYALAFWLLVSSFDLPGEPVQVASAFAAAYVLGFLALFAPAGIGFREASLTAFLGPVMGVTQALTLSIVARLWMTAVEVVPAGALWLLGMAPRSRRPRPPDDPSGSGAPVDRSEHAEPVGGEQ